MTASIKGTGAFFFASIIGAAPAAVELLSDGACRFAIGGSIAPVDITSPVTSLRRVQAATKREGLATVNFVHLNKRVAQKAGLNGGGKGQGIYPNLTDAILNDGRLDRLSKHDRKALAAANTARYTA